MLWIHFWRNVICCWSVIRRSSATSRHRCCLCGHVDSRRSLQLPLDRDSSRHSNISLKLIILTISSVVYTTPLSTSRTSCSPLENCNHLVGFLAVIISIYGNTVSVNSNKNEWLSLLKSLMITSKSGETPKSVRGNHLCTCTYVEQCHYNCASPQRVIQIQGLSKSKTAAALN